MRAGNGNRTAEYGPGDVLIASATHDEQDRLKTYGDATYTWTAAGELLQRERPSERFSTTYDALGNLLSAGITPLTNGVPQGLNIGTTITYRVDGQNRRVQRLVNGVAERGWLYRDGLSPVAELDGSGALLNRYVYGTSSHTPDLVVRGGVVYRVIADHLGSIRMIVDATSGAVAQRLDYDAWGALTVDTAPAWQSLGYVSGIQDRETGLVRFGARDYEAGVGRWTNRDAIWMLDAPNLYAYCAANPVDRRDTAGLYWEYSQSSGTLTHVDETTGARTRTATGYSGHGAGRNNSSREWQGFVGPIPTGRWEIGPLYNHPHLGRNVMNLTPQRPEDAYYRDHFRIHGDNSRGDASEGCIILPRGVRGVIGGSGDRRLDVVP